MTPLAGDQFAEFFEAVHGHKPFSWQRRFAEEVFNEVFHDVIRVPTACGKTSALDVAIFDLALQADRTANERTTARRFCFVVDRRLVVDEVTDHAFKIRDAICAAASGGRNEPVLKAVAERLASLAADADQPLRVIRLRGNVYRDDGWAADPLTPSIIVSTVDQIGSRLLFRGYGVGWRSRPLQAGLLAFDTRIILDEAHLSNVFVETLDAVRRFQGWAEKPPLPPRRFVGLTRMSATMSEEGRSFELRDEERQDERLKPRLQACKPAELIQVEVEPVTKQLRKEQPRKAREQEQKNRDALIDAVVAQAQLLAQFDEPDSPRVIGIVLNRVSAARIVFERLRQPNGYEEKCDAILLTGRVRPYDRDRLLETWLPWIKAGRDRDPERTLFVVATQTVEVGANLDFDALITESASLDALRQRFGRLDRLGRRHEQGIASPARILIRSDHAKTSEDDPIYGRAIATTWELLTKTTAGSKAQRKRNKSKGPAAVDFGVNALDAKLPKDPDASLLAPLRETPLLFPAHLDAWIQTNPAPEPDPDVAPFLHGRADTPADVQVIWRADLAEKNQERWPEIVALMPPRTREALPVPVYEVQAWLRDAARGDIADIEGAGEEDVSGLRGGAPRRVLRWQGAERKETRIIDYVSIRPGDTIVVPAEYGGADEYGWKPQFRRPVRDVAEPCLAEIIASYPATNVFRRPKLRLRLHRDLLPRTEDRATERLRALLQSAIDAVHSEAEDYWTAVRKLLSGMSDLLSSAHRAAVEALLHSTRTPNIQLYPDAAGLVLSGTYTIAINTAPEPSDAETEYDEPEEDEGSFSANGRAVYLAEHRCSVALMAQRFGEGCGVSDELVKVLHSAGYWHDEGKRDPRFQAWLHGSELKALAALARQEVLAKSGRDPSAWLQGTAFGYPRGARHEFLSVRLLEKADLTSGPVDDLARFLIGTHHGYGRPFPPVMDDPDAVEVRSTHDGKTFIASSDHGLYQLDSGWADLFWKMVRRYGWWGIAYLEALLITADRTASAWEQRSAPQAILPAELEAVAAEA